MSARREVDPEARRLLAELDRIEAGPWPAGLPDYAEALLALAVRCEAKVGKAEVYRWMLRELAGVIHARDGRWADARLDAVAVMATTSDGLLLRWRSTLDAARRPNLRSMAGALLGWRGNEIWTSRSARHAQRELPWQADLVVPIGARQETRVVAAEVCDVLEAGGPPERALLRLALGDSIAEAARRTGASRQQVYRARRRLFEHLGMPVEGRPIGERRRAPDDTEEEEPDPARVPGSPVDIAVHTQREPEANRGTDGVEQVHGLYERSDVRSLDPTPVPPRPTPLVRRPMIEAVRPTPTTGADQGRIGPRTTTDRASGQCGRALRVRRAAAADPVVGVRDDQARGLRVVR